MKSFKDYVDKKEEKNTQEEINEDVMVAAATIFGYMAAGTIFTWAMSIVVNGYVSLMSKAIKGITRIWKSIFKGGANASEASKVVREAKQDQAVRVQQNKIKSDRNQYEESLKDVFEAIKNDDSDAAVKALKESDIKQTPIVRRVLVNEIVVSLGEPPIHFGSTGNSTYLFIKKLLGIKTAQVMAKLVKEALKKNATDFIEDDEEDED